MLSRPLLLLSLALTSPLVLAAPVSKTIRRTPTQKITIDPAAKTILERAAKRYGSTARWKGDIVQPPMAGAFSPRTYRYSVAFARPDKLRIEQRFDNHVFVDVTVGAETANTIEASSLGDVGDELYFYLQGQTGLTQVQEQIKAANGHSLLVKRLPDARWRGSTCQRVVVEKHFHPTEEEPVEWERSESWFTQDGQWMRSIRARKTKSFDPDFSFKDAETITSEFKAQNFAPVFGANTFKATPRKMPF